MLLSTALVSFSWGSLQDHRMRARSNQVFLPEAILVFLFTSSWRQKLALLVAFSLAQGVGWDDSEAPITFPRISGRHIGHKLISDPIAAKGMRLLWLAEITQDCPDLTFTSQTLRLPYNRADWSSQREDSPNACNIYVPHKVTGKSKQEDTWDGGQTTEVISFPMSFSPPKKMKYFSGREKINYIICMACLARLGS